MISKINDIQYTIREIHQIYIYIDFFKPNLSCDVFDVWLFLTNLNLEVGSIILGTVVRIIEFTLGDELHDLGELLLCIFNITLDLF